MRPATLGGWKDIKRSSSPKFYPAVTRAGKDWDRDTQEPWDRGLQARGEVEWNEKLANIVPEPVLSKEELGKLVARSVNPNPNRQSGMIHVHSSTAVGRVPAGLGFAAPQDRTAGMPQAWQGMSVLPFEDGELPDPGTLFGLDAEFVALSPPDKIIRGFAPPNPKHP